MTLLYSLLFLLCPEEFRAACGSAVYDHVLRFEFVYFVRSSSCCWYDGGHPGTQAHRHADLFRV